MKKAYSKPKIVLEKFELSTSIATGCTDIVTQAMKEDIELEKEWGYFANTDCEEIGCYHVADEFVNLFYS